MLVSTRRRPDWPPFFVSRYEVSRRKANVRRPVWPHRHDQRDAEQRDGDAPLDRPDGDMPARIISPLDISSDVGVDVDLRASEAGEVLLVFTNANGAATRSIYDLHSGRQFGDALNREGSYRQAFPEDLTDTAIRLNGHWDEEEMQEWGSEIPSSALDVLHNDLRAAQREHGKTHKTHSHATAEHTAAS